MPGAFEVDIAEIETADRGVKAQYVWSAAATAGAAAESGVAQSFSTSCSKLPCSDEDSGDIASSELQRNNVGAMDMSLIYRSPPRSARGADKGTHIPAEPAMTKARVELKTQSRHLAHSADSLCLSHR